MLVAASRLTFSILGWRTEPEAGRDGGSRDSSHDRRDEATASRVGPGDARNDRGLVPTRGHDQDLWPETERDHGEPSEDVEECQHRGQHGLDIALISEARGRRRAGNEGTAVNFDPHM